MLNSQKTSSMAKGKWDALITSLALLLSLLGLGALSIISFYQTMYAFEDLKDPTLVIASLPVGMWIPFFAALASQYGQNLALYARRQFGTEKPVFKFKNFVFKNNHWYLVAFAVTALIDAATNCLWYYNRTAGVEVLVLWKSVMYLFMISLVVVEEVLGVALQAFVRSIVELRRISVLENYQASKDNGNRGGGDFKARTETLGNSFKPRPPMEQKKKMPFVRPEQTGMGGHVMGGKQPLSDDNDDEMLDFFSVNRAISEFQRLKDDD